MDTEKDINWFKNSLEPLLAEYEIEYKFFKEGEFGSFNRASFNNSKKGGYIDFSTSGWVNIYLVDYEKGKEVINLLLEPSEKDKVNNALEDFEKYI